MGLPWQRPLPSNGPSRPSRHLKVLWLHVKICSQEGAWEDQQPPLFISGPLYISETNGARKLNFGVLVEGGGPKIKIGSC